MAFLLPSAPAAHSRLRTPSFRTVGTALLAVNAFAAVLAVTSGPGDGDAGTLRLAALNLALVVPIGACAVRARLGGPRRAAALWLGGAMLAFGLGNLLYVGETPAGASPLLGVLAGLTYLAFYPCAIAAGVSLLRQDRAMRLRSLWLDGALGAAGAATALAAAMSPVLADTDGDLQSAVFGAAYSVGDLMLIAMMGGVLTVRGRRGGAMWLLLAAGLAMFCVGDAIYALQVAAGTYEPGTLWSAPWAVGVSLAALALWRPEAAVPERAGSVDATLVVPTAATAVAVLVLFVASLSPLPVVVVAIATLTLVLAAVRTVLAFRRLRELSDAHQLALTDELTGLGNRRALFERGERRIAGQPGGRVALMLIDLDDFKAVNDSLGHQAGDELLCEVARRLAAGGRDRDLLVRLGGDEFAFVVPLQADEDPLVLAKGLLAGITPPIVVEGVSLRATASAGVATTDAGECGVAELLRRADVAMYAAKAARTRVEAYDPQLDSDNRLRLEMIQDLDVALTQEQFLLHYQPKVDARTGRVTGAEALVRWNHPARGLVRPDAFLPLVEQGGLMGTLTRVVLGTAVRQLAVWRATGLDIAVAVNLSASDLLDKGLIDHVVALLARHGVPGCALELEITETVLVADPDRAREVLARLRGHGVRVAVDDYGTGYSSLAYLRDLPIDELKLDRSFIAPMLDDPRSASIVRSTIDLAHSLGLRVVAEGVEHERTRAALAELGCDFAQGYHFSRPLPAAAFTAWLARAAEAAASPRV